MVRAGVALLAEQVIAPVLAAFRAEYPGVVLDRTTAVSERLLAQVNDGRLHVAFVHEVPVLVTLPQVDWEVVRRGRLAVLMTRWHPLAGRAAVALSQLRAETFLVNPRELAPSAVQGLKLMCAEFGGFDPRVLESGTRVRAHARRRLARHPAGRRRRRDGGGGPRAMCPRTSRWSRSSHRPATRSPSPGAAGSTPHCSTGSSASSATTGHRRPAG